MSAQPPDLSFGPEPGRIAEVLVTTVKGKQNRGSGYRITAEAVLTAAHVVDDAESVSIRFDAAQPTEWAAPGKVLRLDPAADVAILRLEIPGEPAPVIAPARFGGLGNRSAVVDAVAVGFPRFKLRRRGAGEKTGHSDPHKAGSYRDRVQAMGRIPVLSNSKEGTLELITDPPAPDPDEQHSPWEGMSGAAVWVGENIVGVVSKHHRSDSPARLSVARLDRWLSRIHLDERASVTEALGLTSHPASLADVIPPRRSEALARGYLDQVRDLAPDELLDRDDELAELTRFCAGDQPYAWWQGQPWAGKTALAAWLVLHPPAGVEVASFFITSRWAGQADSDAYTAEFIQQLAAIADQPEPSASSPSAREKARRYLLGAAIDRCVAGGQRLLLVVDGLDEDRSSAVGAGQMPSIASLLPLRVPPGLRVLVTSRPHPGLPADVPPGHPLGDCLPRQLARSPHALELAKLATNELKQRRASQDSRIVDVLGYLTASGGGLTAAEIGHLTGLPDWMLLDLFSSVFGRTLRGRTARDNNRVYLFAHETLYEQAKLLFQGDLARYRQEIHRWADSYRDRDWPAETPRYLLAPYGRLLASLGDSARLAQIAASPARHDRMLAHEHHDADALTEILAARRSLAPATQPDVTALGKLAVSEWRLQTRNLRIPVRLPAVWAVLGEPDRAEQTARTITDLEGRAAAFARLSAALAGTDSGRATRLADEAERAARAITDDEYQRSAALSSVASALAGTDPGRAERIARTIELTHSKADGLAAVAAVLAGTDAVRANLLAIEAEKAARVDPAPYLQFRPLTAVAAVLARIDLAGAIRVALSIGPLIGWRAEALAAVAAARAGTDIAGSRRLAAQAEQMARTITKAGQRAEALADVAAALAGTDPTLARRLATEAEVSSRTDPDVGGRGRTLERVAGVLAGTDLDRAMQIARTITPPHTQDAALDAMATSLAAIDLIRAEQVARTIADADRRAAALTDLAARIADTDQEHAAGLALGAEQTARTQTDTYEHADALAAVVAVLATIDANEAEQAARAITKEGARAEALADVAAALASAEPDRASRLAADAEQAAGAIAFSPLLRAKARASVAAKLATTDAARFGRLIAAAKQDSSELIPDPQAEALTAVAIAQARTDPNAAEQTARGIIEDYRRAMALTAVATELAGTDPERAERIARSITYAGSQARGVAAAAAALASTNARHAAQLAADVAPMARAISGASVRAETLADLAAAQAPTDPVIAGELAAEAADAARENTHPHWRAVAVTAAATGMAATDPACARVILADAMFAEGIFVTLSKLQPVWTAEAVEISRHAMLCIGATPR